MNTPDWSKAPEGATHWDSECGIFCNGNGFFYADETYQKLAAKAHVGWGTSRYIPRPTQWRGPQDGLPPVGMVCQAMDVTTGEWENAEVIGRRRDKTVVALTDMFDKLMYCDELRPIQSDRDRAIEEIECAINEQGCILRDLVSSSDVAEALYNAGLRKT